MNQEHDSTKGLAYDDIYERFLLRIRAHDDTGDPAQNSTQNIAHARLDAALPHGCRQ